VVRAHVGTAAFALSGLGLFVAAALPFVLLAPLLTPARRYAIFVAWLRAEHLLLRLCCGLGFDVSGLEHLPRQPSLVFAKHQSMLEVFTLPLFLPPQVWVLKEELLELPLFGRAARLLGAIPIRRGSGLAALEAMLHDGLAALHAGRWLVIFPEGTRVPAGQRIARLKRGAGMLAAATGAPVVPVAHNAGCFWHRQPWPIRAGTVHYVIGPVIDPAGRKAPAINREVQSWLDTTTTVLEQQAGLIQANSTVR
jgi:1-acyl-sn-glycerol-3-phosphate acyltransferase